MRGHFARLLTVNNGKWILMSVFLLASNAAIGMSHSRLQQQSVHDRAERVTLRDHKCVSVPSGATFEFYECVYVTPTALYTPTSHGHDTSSTPFVAGDFCTGSCLKGTPAESFKVCKPQQGSYCSAEYKEVKVKITHQAPCVEEERTNRCKCGVWQKLRKPTEGAMLVPRCD